MKTNKLSISIQAIIWGFTLLIAQPSALAQNKVVTTEKAAEKPPAEKPPAEKSISQEGLGKLEKNMQNSKSNLGDYQKNLTLIDENLTEVKKAKDLVDGQKNNLGKTLKENELNQKKVLNLELDVNKQIKFEDLETKAEATKVIELEKMIANLKANQLKRQENVTKYKEQLTQLAKEKSEWKLRQDELSKQAKQVNERLTGIVKTQKDWQAKRKGYESEVKKWTKESDKHKSIYEQYTAFAENKE